jgi:hypothetical protein
MLGFEFKLIAWLATLAIAAGGFFLFVRYERQLGAQACLAAQAKIEARATEEARQKESNWQTNVEALEEVHRDERQRIESRRIADIASLRNRSDVRAADLPASAASAAEGGTGAGLSRLDAEFLAGEAARANRLRAALATCQDWIDAVTK